jgi:hypothetical protein
VLSGSNGFNCKIDGGAKNWVGYNLLECVGGEENVWICGTPTAEIYCNEMINNETTNLQALNDNAGTDIRGNEFNSSSYNLMYGTHANHYVITGEQLHRGNIFDASTTQSPKARDHALLDLAVGNQYKVEGTQGGSSFPYFISTYSDWFEGENGTAYDCPPGYGGTGDRYLDEILTRIRLFDDGFYTDTNQAERFDACLKSLRALDLYQASGGEWTTEMSDWYYAQANQSSDPWKCYQHEKAIRQAFSIPDSTSNQIIGFMTELDSIACLLDSSIYYSVTSTGVISYLEPAYSDYLELLNLYDSLSVLLNEIHEEIHSTDSARIAQLLGANNNLSVSFTQAWNLKACWKYTLQSMQKNFRSFDSTAMGIIDSIAALCSYEGGEGVLMARSLKARQTQVGSQYSDNCASVQRTRKIQSKNLSTQFNLMPNPADEYLTISLDPFIENGTLLRIIDMTGRELWSQTCHENNMIRVSTTNFPQGLYMLTGSNTGKNIKFIISHEK